MDQDPTPSVPGPEEAQLLVIVVGAHLRAEVADRPLAYRLKQAVELWLEAPARRLNVPLTPVVCTDIWYLNHEALQQRPTISIGGPGVNALSAFYASRLTSAATRANEMVIQLDPEFVDLRASIWGLNHQLTVEALQFFVEHFMDGYLRACATQVEPKED
jgi:hypothetical protein